MTQTTAPVGTVAVVGHPGNNLLAVKTDNGWFWITGPDAPRRMDEEDFRAGWDIYRAES